MTQVLVTGAAGFIGSHVVRMLMERGYAVRAMILPGETQMNLTGEECERVEGDVTNPDSLRRAMAGCRQVIHLAAIYALWLPDKQQMRRVNVGGTRNVLQLARELGVERVVCTSSIARFGGQGAGRQGTECSSFALAKTRNTYAITKAEAHELAVAAARAGQDVVIVAPTGPIGPGDVGPTPTGRLVLAAATLPVVAVPDTVTNMADVRDIALGHVLALEKGKTGESYLLGNQNVSALQLAQMAMSITGKRRPLFSVPFPVAKLAGKGMEWISEYVTRRPPLITGDSVAIGELGLAADCSKAVAELGLPQTPLETALEDALEWFDRVGFLQQKALWQALFA